MLENLAYCLNATAPIFLLMLLGLVFRRLGFFSQAFADQAQRFRLQGGAAGHALQGSGGIRLLHRVGRAPLCSSAFWPPWAPSF